MSEPALVLDNSILSALHASGWFDAPAFYAPNRRVLVPSRVWNDEFDPYHDVDRAPEWATIREADLESVRTPALGQLSKPDWSCIGVAERNDDSIIVTNDRVLHEVANRRNVTVEWGTRFVIRTYQACGITVSDFEAGVDSYVEDVTLPAEVADEVRNAEKE